MSENVSLTHGEVTLVRATPDQRPAIERLQHAAYKRNRELLGLEPLPLLADYGAIFRDYEVWIAPSETDADEVGAALILETGSPDDVLVWSIARAPGPDARGLGGALLLCAEGRARQLGHDTIRLYTGAALTDLIDWYARNGYEIECREQLSDRMIVHMLKKLSP